MFSVTFAVLAVSMVAVHKLQALPRQQLFALLIAPLLIRLIVDWRKRKDRSRKKLSPAQLATYRTIGAGVVAATFTSLAVYRLEGYLLPIGIALGSAIIALLVTSLFDEHSDGF